MISSEVQRTLVKSPPELWAEISDPASLARHLGEFGEIRITRVEPEQRVEWQAGDTSGSVVIKPSGWGTKVKLTVTREVAQLDVGGAERERQETTTPEFQQPTIVHTPPEPESQPEPEASPIQSSDFPAEVFAAGHDAEPIFQPILETEAEPAPIFEPSLETEAQPETERDIDDPPTPAPRRGFFARLFGRRHAAPPIEPAPRIEAEDAVEHGDQAPPGEPQTPAPERYNALAVWASQIEPDGADDVVWQPEPALLAEPEPALGAEPKPAPPAEPEPALGVTGDDLGESRGRESDGSEAASAVSAELATAESVAAQQVTAVLTGVLDRLGAAHHRPFSRS